MVRDSYNMAAQRPRAGSRRAVVGFVLLDAASISPSYSATGSISGSVLDPAQTQVAGARIAVRNVPLIPPGSYEIQASMAGFQTAVRAAISLRVDETLRGSTSAFLRSSASLSLESFLPPGIGFVFQGRC